MNTYFSCIYQKDKSYIAEDGKKYYAFKITSSNIDRIGDRIIPSGIDTSEYLTNNVVFYNHDKHLVIGTSIIELSEDGSEMYGYVNFDELSELSKMVKNQVENESLKTASIGLNVVSQQERLPTESEKLLICNRPYLRKITDINKSILIEWSIVTLPMNTAATRQRALEKGFDLKEINLTENKEFETMENELNKAGAKVSKSRLEKILNAIALLQEVVADTEQPAPDIQSEPMDSEIDMKLDEKNLEIELLMKQLETLKSELKNYKDNEIFMNIIKGI